jgi:hypothetical protein
MDFTDSVAIPHGKVTVIQPNPVEITMLYIDDAIFYTKECEDGELILPTLEETYPVENGSIKAPPENINQVLDMTASWGYSAATLGMDIQCQEGGRLDILFDNTMTASIPHQGTPQEILITNLEPSTESDPRRTIITENFEYGLGDFFRYYELFNVEKSKFHIWEKHAKSLGGKSGRTGDCHKVRVNFPNLNDLL